MAEGATKLRIAELSPDWLKAAIGKWHEMARLATAWRSFRSSDAPRISSVQVTTRSAKACGSLEARAGVRPRNTSPDDSDLAIHSADLLAPPNNPEPKTPNLSPGLCPDCVCTAARELS